MDCVERIIKKDWIHPISGDKLTEKDIIPLQRVKKQIIIILLHEYSIDYYGNFFILGCHWIFKY